MPSVAAEKHITPEEYLAEEGRLHATLKTH